MPDTVLFVPGLHSQADADAVMFELQDLPCIHHAEVDLAQRQAHVGHTAMISAEDIVHALEEAGYPGATVAEG